MADPQPDLGRAIDYCIEDLARSFISPFSGTGYERAAARAHISLRVTLRLISGEDPRAVLASLQALLVKLAEPARLRSPVTPVTTVTP